MYKMTGKRRSEILSRTRRDMISEFRSITLNHPYQYSELGSEEWAEELLRYMRRDQRVTIDDIHRWIRVHKWITMRPATEYDDGDYIQPGTSFMTFRDQGQPSSPTLNDSAIFPPLPTSLMPGSSPDLRSPITMQVLGNDTPSTASGGVQIKRETGSNKESSSNTSGFSGSQTPRHETSISAGNISSQPVNQTTSPEIQDLAMGFSYLENMSKLCAKYPYLERCNLNITRIHNRMQKMQTKCVLGKKAFSVLPKQSVPSIKLEMGMDSDIHEIEEVDLTSFMET